MDPLLQSCCDMAGELAAALGIMLRERPKIAVVDVDRIPYGEFLAGLETPAFFNLVKSNPPGDCLMLAIEPSILYPMIDRLLGGEGDDCPPCRPLSDIELPLAARVVRLFLEQLGLAWRHLADVQLAVVAVESNPRLMRALPADEPVTVVRFRVCLGRCEGSIWLCLPRRLIDGLATLIEQSDGSPVGPVLEAATSASSVEVTVTLATTPVDDNQLRSLRIGDIIATETAAGAPAVMSVGGRPAFLARPGVYEGRMAVCIAEAIPSATAEK
ncbi:MAG: FliM/FliN family flagellar motor switch protein [Thermoguttaceae bacterium]